MVYRVYNIIIMITNHYNNSLFPTTLLGLLGDLARDSKVR